MSLTAGTRLGPYEIISPIGAGGMGEVYKARDTRLDRIVAVKVSNQQFSERFEREARAVAALNHSNICTLHDVGPNYLVMEYIEGSPLKGPVPLDQALKYAGQICDALDAAHKKGITHRDLKPANILVTKSGIKLLDFGLAKLNIQSGGENTPTRTLHDTGGVVGTPAYMAPEQWEGKPADARTDVYGFGCVLYELLTGERAMRVAGQNTSALDSQPQLIQRVIHACLAQDPDDRWQSAKDIRKALDLAASQVPAPVAAKQSKAGLIGWIAAGVFAIASGALAYMHAQQKPPESPVVRFTIPPPVKHGYGLPTISPDGRRIAFTAAESQGKLSLWVRDLNSTAPKALAGTEGSEFTTWSPDGRYVAFTSQTQLKKVNVDTGIIEPICDLASFVQGLAWTPDGQIIVGLNLDSIHIVPDGGGALKTLLTLDQSRKETRQYWPTLTPDGKHVFYLVTSALPEVAGIWVASIANPADRHRVLPDPSQAAYSQGHLLFVRKGNLVAQPFDLDALKVTGEAQPIVEDVTYNAAAGFADFTVSPNGVLAIGAHEQPSKLMTFDRAGNIQKIFGAGARRYQIVNISPDQSKVAADAPGDPGYELFVFDPARDATSQVTVGANTGNFPVWSPDGTKLAFGSNREGVYNIYLKPASGGGWRPGAAQEFGQQVRDGLVQRRPLPHLRTECSCRDEARRPVGSSYARGRSGEAVCRG